MIPFNHKKTDFNNKIYTDKFGEFLKAWKWKNKNDDWIFCTAAYKEKEKGKHGNSIFNFVKFIYQGNEWCIDNGSKNNPLYNIKEIVDTEKLVVIVDNELSIDILNKTNKDDFIFTTWPGDIIEIENADFSILKNKQVYYFSNSYIFSKTAIKFFEKNFTDIVILPLMVESPGWNIVDNLERYHLDRETIRAYIIHKETKLKEEQEIIKQEYVDEIKFPFKILGPGAGYYYFLHGENGEIFKAKQGGLNNSILMHLAPLEFWENYFYYTTGKGVKIIDWKGATDFLIRQVNILPPFDHNKIRGRGIWQDGDKLIIHTGKNLIIGDKKIEIVKQSPNGHVYERIPELKLNIKKLEINEFEIMKIKNCIDKLSIDTYLEKMYLLGWCALAPLCGALEWRPHIWLTGSSGSGKSAVITRIILKLLGDFKIYAEGGTTGAGIFQRLKRTNDCFPVIHDEVDKKGKESLELEIEMIRSCSSTQGIVFKGTADQSGKEYTFNSMFCLSSVNIILSKKSNKSRFSVINISKNENIDWQKFRKEIYETFTTEMCEKVRSLFFYNWPIVKKNIENFKDVAGIYCGDQRSGDQAGTLLAGYFMLCNMKVYEISEIQNICEKYLQNFMDGENYMNDEIELLNKIFTSKIKYLGYDEKYHDTTLLNLLKKAAGEDEENQAPDPRARKELFKYGINYSFDKGKLYIAYKYEWIKNMLIKTAWYDNYGDVLKRLSFAEKRTEVVYFGGYYTGRAVVLDAKCVLRLSDDLIYMEAGI